ncbi:MAG: AmmeMemoRadiSam system radical SAM enzyme [Chitinivibrionales bacterium]|nr:AmmeMemoRadiSam system radical SAM enzyme [Chitinivibrionales bacterium]
MHEALFYTPLENGKVRCELCPHFCLLTKGKSGICLARKNIDGKLVSLSFGRPVSTAIDPIEKKPLFHFYPGSQIFSTGPSGCTLKCAFCQNYSISQKMQPAEEQTIAVIIDQIVKSRTLGVAYTYSEPYTWFETILQIAPCVQEQGLKNVMVTNGYYNPGPLKQLLPFIDAMNIDIKSMTESFYKSICKGSLAPVLQTCETVKKKCHLEITTLLIPGENDSPEEIGKLTDFIATNLGTDTPLHFSRYFPRYRLAKEPTPAATLTRAWEIARSKLSYVYMGNISSGDGENTYCPSCNNLLIDRKGYRVRLAGLKPEGRFGACANCGFATNIVLS